MRHLALILLIAAAARGAEPTPRQIFEQRLLPIFKSPDPSSCVQCHLGGVELKNYIRPTHEQTFASLRDQGLIDLDQPAKSRILALIRMGEHDAGTTLIQKETREAELAAFAAWIERSAADPALRRLPKTKAEELARPALPNEVIRHARVDRVLESFTNTIWPMRFRCMGCHSEGSAENRKHVAEHGERVAWFKSGGPMATLTYLRKSGLINVDDPARSLLLRKPLNEVKHGGGQKIDVGDQGYKAIRAFVDDFARLVKGGYADAAALPKADDGPRRFGSDIWLKLERVPPEWGDKLLQVNVHAWDAAARDWEPRPIATSDRVTWGKGKLWQHTLTLLADKGSPRAARWMQAGPTLPPGKYQVRVFVDRDGKLAKDWRAMLDAANFAGSAEVESNWTAGYGRMTAIDASRVTR